MGEKMVSLLDPEDVREEVGVAEVKAVFGSGKGKVAGCYVSDGKLLKNCLVSVSRGGEVVYEGPLSSLRARRTRWMRCPWAWCVASGRTGSGRPGTLSQLTASRRRP